MSPTTALTIIAVSFAVLTVLALVVAALLFSLVKRLGRLEQSVIREISDLRSEIQTLMRHIHNTSETIGHTVHEVQKTARRLGLLASGIGSWIGARRIRGSLLDKTRPWWMSGLALGWTIYQRRRKAQKARSSPPLKGSTPM